MILDFEKKVMPKKTSLWGKWALRLPLVIISLLILYYLKAEFLEDVHLKEMLTLVVLFGLLSASGVIFASVDLFKKDTIKQRSILGIIINLSILSLLLYKLMPYYHLLLL